MQHINNNFAQGSIASHIWRLSVPMTIAQLINILYNIIDRVFIGRLPDDSTNALTGLGIAFPICTLTIAFANLVGTGGGPLFSIERGKGDDKEAEQILGNSFVLLIVTGIIIGVGVSLIKTPLLYLFGASDATFGYAYDYISIYLMGTVFVMLSLGLNYFINAQGFAKIGMATVSIGAVCNVILDPIFIFGLDMGVKGAAYATVISQFLSAVWTTSFLLGRHTEIKLKVSAFKLKADRVKKILALGLSGFTMQITNGATQIVCNKMLSIHGGDAYIAAMTIINSVREVVTLGVTGVGSGTQPVISYNYGAAKYDRVKYAIRLMAAVLLVYTTAAWLLVMVFSKQLVGFFNNDPSLLPIATSSMHIYFFGFFMMMFQFTGQTVFQALGKAKFAMFFSMLRKVIIVIPLTCLLPLIPAIGVNGVFLAEPISNFIGGLACFMTMYIVVYKRLGKTA